MTKAETAAIARPNVTAVAWANLNAQPVPTPLRWLLPAARVEFCCSSQSTPTGWNLFADRAAVLRVNREGVAPPGAGRR